MTTLVGFLQIKTRRRERVRTVTKEHRRSLGRYLNKAMPVALDTTGVMLLSGSVILVNLAAGIAAVGVGLIVLNWRFYGGK